MIDKLLVGWPMKKESTNKQYLKWYEDITMTMIKISLTKLALINLKTNGMFFWDEVLNLTWEEIGNIARPLLIKEME